MVNPRIIEVAALATDYGFRRVRQDRIMEEATDLYVAARAETRKECYAEIEQSLTKICCME